MNIKAAYLHLLTDVMTSVVVVGGGLLMYYFGLFWIDPVISVLIALYLMWASLDLYERAVPYQCEYERDNEKEIVV